jgi:hypothetical protein
MTAAWPDSTEQGGRVWKSATDRGAFYRDVLTADHVKWFADNEGKVWRWPADVVPPTQPADKPDYGAMADYITNKWQCIPLYRYDHVNPDNPTETGKSPCGGKGWNKLTLISEQVIEASKARGGNVGVLPDHGQMILDIDPKNGGDASFDKLCTDTGLDPATLPQVNTGGDGRHFYMLKRRDAEISSKALKAYPGIDVRSDRAGQCVGVGSRHPNGKLYTQATDHPPLSAAPMASAELLAVLVKHKPNEFKPAPAIKGDAISGGDLTKMLAVLNIMDYGTRDDHLAMLFACHAATGGSADGLKVFKAWSAGNPEHKNKAGNIERKWDSADDEREDGIGAGTLYKALKDAGRADLIPGHVEQAEPVWSHLMTRDPKDIPRRQWEIEGLLMRAVVTILCGHGGAGKSLWSLYIALACVLAQEWAGYSPTQALNVLEINAEDSVDELDLRLESALQSFKGRTSELRKLATERLHTVKIPNYYLVSKEGDKAAHRTKFFMELLTYIRDHKIGLLIFDPAVSAHFGLDENSAEMQFLIESFRILAVTCNIPVLLVHHYRKAGIAGDANSARGSSTMIDASRIVVTVDPMDAKEADNMLTDVEQRGSYFSTTLGKANYSRKAPRQWFRIDGTVLPNGESAPRLIVTEFGGDGETMSDAEMEDFLDMVAEGRGAGKLYTVAGKDDVRLDHVLLTKFNIPRDRAKAIIGNLTKAGILGLVEYERGDRKTGKGYVVLKRAADATEVLI